MSTASAPARQVANVVDLDHVKEKFSNILAGEEDAIDTEVQTAVKEIGVPRNREAFYDWINQLDEDVEEKIVDILLRSEKRNILRARKRKAPFIESSEYSDVDNIADDLQLIDVAYYDAFFKFANMSQTVYSVDVGPEFSNISENSETVEDAKENFSSYAERNLPEEYSQAIGDIPSPLVGQVERKPKPRLIQFEDPSQIFIEYWSLGKMKDVYHPQRGETLNFRGLVRSQVRIYIDEELVEFTSTRKTQGHRIKIENHLSDAFDFDKEAATDGGKSVGTETTEDEAQTLSNHKKTIDSDDISSIINSIGIISTLETFQSRNATIRYSSVNKRDVSEGPNHDDVESNTKYRRANVQILIEDPGDKCRFVSPDEVNSKFTFAEDASMRDIINRMHEDDYENLSAIPISLNAKENTLLFDQENYTPSTRKTVFNLVAGELGW